MSSTLLLVEDDPKVLLGTKQALELAGFEAEPFTDAETAAMRIVPDLPAIVVCDVNLPGANGFSLAFALKVGGQPPGRHIDHGSRRHATAVNAMRRGACDFVEKPFRPSD
jgi:DNA-binding NtrC family response regulator